MTGIVFQLTQKIGEIFLPQMLTMLNYAPRNFTLYGVGDIVFSPVGQNCQLEYRPNDLPCKNGARWRLPFCDSTNHMEYGWGLDVFDR